MSSTSALAPALNRSTTKLAVKDIPLSRNPSYSAQPLEREQVEDIYKTGVYADPKPTKQWGLGQALFTPDHKKLLARFRDECVRLSSHNKDLRDRVTGLDRKVRRDQATIERLENVLADTKGRLTSQKEQLVALSEELAIAHTSLAEMDAVFADNRHKRLSRLAGRGLDLSDDVKADLARIH